MLNTKELLEKSPKTTNIVKEWFKKKMEESFKDVENIPEEIMEEFRNTPIKDENIISIIDSNPSVLFSLFDEYELFFTIERHHQANFRWNIGKWEGLSPDRPLAERNGIIKLFEELEEKL